MSDVATVRTVLKSGVNNFSIKSSPKQRPMRVAPFRGSSVVLCARLMMKRLLTVAASPLVAAQGVLTKGVDPRERPLRGELRVLPVHGNGSVPSDFCKN